MLTMIHMFIIWKEIVTLHMQLCSCTNEIWLQWLFLHLSQAPLSPDVNINAEKQSQTYRLIYEYHSDRTNMKCSIQHHQWQMPHQLGMKKHNTKTNAHIIINHIIIRLSDMQQGCCGNTARPYCWSVYLNHQWQAHASWEELKGWR